MTVVLDTNVVVALYDAADPDHQVVADWIATIDEDLVATPLVVAEMDYLVAHRGGASVAEAATGAGAAGGVRNDSRTSRVASRPSL